VPTSVLVHYFFGAKNLFSHFQVAFPKEPQIPAREIQSLEEMLHELKLYWLEKSTFTRVLIEPTYDASTLPPVIAPSLRSDEVVNTEAEKKSVYLSSQVDGEKNNHFTINSQFAIKYSKRSRTKKELFPHSSRAKSNASAKNSVEKYFYFVSSRL